MIRAFADGAMGRRIDPSWKGPIELFLVPASAPRLVFVDTERDLAPWQERSLMVRWVVRSILHGEDPLSYFSFQPVLLDWSLLIQSEIKGSEM